MYQHFFEKVKATYAEFVTLFNNLITKQISTPQTTVCNFVVEVIFVPSKIIERKNIEMTFPLTEHVLISYIHQKIVNSCFWFMTDKGNPLLEDLLNEYQKIKKKSCKK